MNDRGEEGGCIYGGYARVERVEHILCTCDDNWASAYVNQSLLDLECNIRRKNRCNIMYNNHPNNRSINRRSNLPFLSLTMTTCRRCIFAHVQNEIECRTKTRARPCGHVPSLRSQDDVEYTSYIQIRHTILCCKDMTASILLSNTLTKWLFWDPLRKLLILRDVCTVKFKIQSYSRP